MSTNPQFIKYCSLENHYNGKHLNRIPAEFKEIKYAVSEKLDGANVQLYFRPKLAMSVGKRTQFFTQDSGNLFGIWDVLPNYKEFTDKMQHIADYTGDSFRVYGELYGAGINKRISYGDGKSKYLKFFDIMMNDEYMTQQQVLVFTKLHALREWFVDIKVYPTLMDALSVDVEAANAEKLTSEGIVIKPYSVNVMLYGNERLAIKKKSTAFADKMEGAHNENKIRQFDPRILNASNEFKKYLTNNRLIDLFSKHGKMQNMQEMGTYIKFYLDDAKADYVKDHDISEFNEKEIKDIFNVGSTVALMLKASLNDAE